MLKDDFEKTCAVNRFAKNTADGYWGWIKDYIIYNNKTHPSELGAEEVTEYIKHLAHDRKLSYSAQSVALNALVFLYKKVLKKRIKIKKDYRTKKPKTLPTIFNHEEVEKLINGFWDEEFKLVTELLYGCGLRKSEAFSIRLKDVDLQRKMLSIKFAKGAKDRNLPIPDILINPLRLQIDKATKKFKQNLNRNFKGVVLPDAVKNKNPKAAFELGWQYLFPAKNLIKTTRQQYHVHTSTYDKMLKKVAREQEIKKNVKAHSFRHSYATHLLEAGYSTTFIKEKLGHNSIKTTEIYLQTTEKTEKAYQSPLDKLNRHEPKIYRITGS